MWPREGISRTTSTARWPCPGPRRHGRQRRHCRLDLSQRLAVDPGPARLGAGATGDSQGYEASQALPYNFGARLTEYVTHPSPVPVGFWRSVGASINTFAVESMIDELALAVGQDPYEFRRARLTNPRWLAVLEAAANGAGWSTKPAGRGAASPSARRSTASSRRWSRCQVGAQLAHDQVPAWRSTTTSPSAPPGRGADRRRCGARPECGAVRPADLQQRRGAEQNFNHSRMIRLGEMPTVGHADHAAAGRHGPDGQHRRRRRACPRSRRHWPTRWRGSPGTRTRTLPFFPNATMGDGWSPRPQRLVRRRARPCGWATVRKLCKPHFLAGRRAASAAHDA